MTTQELTIKNLDSKEVVAFVGIHQELKKAETKHPTWPKDDLFHQVVILTEEAGEVAKAALDYHNGKLHLHELKEELHQTAAMCVRILKHLPNE